MGATPKRTSLVAENGSRATSWAAVGRHNIWDRFAKVPQQRTTEQKEEHKLSQSKAFSRQTKGENQNKRKLRRMRIFCLRRTSLKLMMMSMTMPEVEEENGSDDGEDEDNGDEEEGDGEDDDNDDDDDDQAINDDDAIDGDEQSDSADEEHQKEKESCTDGQITWQVHANHSAIPLITKRCASLATRSMSKWGFCSSSHLTSLHSHLFSPHLSMLLTAPTGAHSVARSSFRKNS
jgi:hypothetical protein